MVVAVDDGPQLVVVAQDEGVVLPVGVQRPGGRGAAVGVRQEQPGGDDGDGVVVLESLAARDGADGLAAEGVVGLEAAVLLHGPAAQAVPDGAFTRVGDAAREQADAQQHDADVEGDGAGRQQRQQDGAALLHRRASLPPAPHQAAQPAGPHRRDRGGVLGGDHVHSASSFAGTRPDGLRAAS